MHNICACQNRYIHKECQRKLLASIERDGKCSVCRQEYTNVKVEQSVIVNRRYIWFRIVDGMAIGCIFISFLLVTIQLDTLLRLRPSSLCYSLNTSSIETLDNSTEFLTTFQTKTSCMDTTIIAYGAVSLTILFLIVICFLCLNVHWGFARYFRAHSLYFVNMQIKIFDAFSNILAPDSAYPDAAYERISET